MMGVTSEIPSAAQAVEIYSRYLPDLILHQVIADGVSHEAHGERFDCAVLFADISGFTPLAERLTRKGAAGAERLTEILNDYFSRLIDLVDQHGGDVLKFAGDALIAIWRAEGESLNTATHRAAQAALVLQQALRSADADGEPLQLRVAIGAGLSSIAHLGGALDRWEFIISGLPLEQVGAVSSQVTPGTVGASGAAWTLLEAGGAGPQGQALSADAHQLDALRPIPPTPRPQRPVLGLEHGAALRRYLPAAIVHRINAGFNQFLGELRRVTVLFVNLPGLSFRTPIGEAQAVMIELQQSCYHYEGSINKLSVDDKGVSLLAAAGLPPLAHEDDPDRGLRIGLRMLDRLQQLGVRCSIGISTGRVYCGAVGSDQRREYTIMGDSVNLAARLMQEADGGILCDEATRRRAGADIEFDPPQELQLKGRGTPVLAARPRGVQAGSRKREERPLVGRQRERARLAAWLESLLGGGREPRIVLAADAGMGKTVLLEELIRRARWLPVTVHVARADAVERATSYHAWQQVLRPLLRTDAETDWQCARNRVLEALNASGQSHLAPLLNDVLPLAFAENELTLQMGGEARADNTRAVICTLLRQLAATAHHLLVIDDAQWLDSASWGVLNRVCQELSPLMVLVAARPTTQTLAEYVQWTRDPQVEHLPLGRMDREEIRQLVCAVLGVEKIADSALRLITERAEGHPYFSEELALALRDSGALDADGQLAAATGAAAALDLPDSVEGIITARVDRLQPSCAMTLKVASVVGRSFGTAALSSVHPSRGSDLAGDLDDLDALALIQQEAPPPDSRYVFRHRITQEVVYGMMLHNQRRQLHARVAQWLESHHEDLRHHYPLLAHHWAGADQRERALNYLEVAAQDALAIHAPAEAARFLEQALAMSREQPVPVVRRGCWWRLLGEAYREQARLDEAVDASLRAAAELSAPMPQARASLGWAILREARKQLRASRGRYQPQALAEAEVVRRTEAATAYEQIQVIFYWRGEKLELLYACLRAANLAESTGRHPRVLTRIYSTLGAAAGVIRLRRAAEYYCERAERKARDDGAGPTLAWVLLPVATYRAGLGEWGAAERRFREALEITRKLGDEPLWISLTASHTVTLLMQGRLSQCLDNYEALREAGVRRDHDQAYIWGVVGRARTLLRTGDWTGMAAATRDAARRLEACTAANRLDVHTLLALVHLLEGEVQASREEIETCLTLLDRPSQNTLYPSCIQLNFACQELARRLPRDRRLAQAARQAVRYFQRYARVFPIGEPGWRYFAGLDAWRRGRRRRALAQWQRSLAAARRLGMPYEAALVAHTLRVTAQTIADVDAAAVLAEALAQLGIDRISCPYRLDAKERGK